ncbi:DNA binding protein [Arthrobacter phage EastWest]|uniref:DNA binding protein n=1 Tax=Arthrobacter phage EastWest TaxID=2894292 RepID=A0AAE9C9N5_9CAUD|nr:DNA binding protein [Arthrobacter phage EastWest]
MSLPSKGPNSPFSAGGRTLLARTCVDCGKFADGESFPLLNAGTKNVARRRNCHDCQNAKKKRLRDAGVYAMPAPRPPEVLQTSAYRRWEKSDDAKVRELIAEGVPYEQIAVTLGRSLRAVYKRREVLGLARVRASHRVAQPWRIG